MNKINRSTVNKARHKKVLKRAKGFYGARSRTFKSANQATIKAMQYAYRDRRVRKRSMRALWITRLNSLARQNNMSYSYFINALKQLNVTLNRKILSDISIYNPQTSEDIIKQIKNIEIDGKKQ